MDKRTFIKDMAILGAGAMIGGCKSARVLSDSQLPKILPPFQSTPLGYGFDALEPHIDARTMEIHFTKHYQGYINNLNKALENGSAYAGKDIVTILQTVKASDASVRNNAGGFYNHHLFWKWLTPHKTSLGTDLALAINKTFGSLSEFKTAFDKEAAGVFGSGWAWLVVDAKKQLKITSTHNQDSPLNSFAEMRGIPVLGLDVWEHAYYLKHQNKRAEYISSFWNVVNWDQVSQDYKTALG